ncbi:hypothetical protein AB0I72_11745 [Nocardiopsis sp. NPDC049922]|uniref:hypothetical protein n=1 Tax=Nocardiopsis sp. NPDC049922 TaxID=3155157 RepID=UPI0033CE4430
MELKRISGDCWDGDCPAVYATDRDTYIVQGYTISDPKVLADLGLPNGESAVEVPVEMLKGIHLASEQ